MFFTVVVTQRCPTHIIHHHHYPALHFTHITMTKCYPLLEPLRRHPHCQVFDSDDNEGNNVAVSRFVPLVTYCDMATADFVQKDLRFVRHHRHQGYFVFIPYRYRVSHSIGSSWLCRGVLGSVGARRYFWIHRLVAATDCRSLANISIYPNHAFLGMPHAWDTL